MGARVVRRVMDEGFRPLDSARGDTGQESSRKAEISDPLAESDKYIVGGSDGAGSESSEGSKAVLRGYATDLVSASSQTRHDSDPHLQPLSEIGQLFQRVDQQLLPASGAAAVGYPYLRVAHRDLAPEDTL